MSAKRWALHRIYLPRIANAPAVLEAYVNFMSALSHGALDPKLREQLAVTVAGFNGCNYCASAHVFLGGKAGIDKDEMLANINGKSSDRKIQAAIDFARALMEQRGKVGDADLKAVRAAGFNDEEVVEILAHVALNTFTNYFNETALTEIDFPAVNINAVKTV
jgi:uncharacterized peroxidase-related enzyme